ncbi:MAG: hypothetical protein H6624_13145 [Bdellovibrionaceae bacterium]|nr:hypothetical protein [Bdellovibrionales bacterium]MCB9085288.1 hypothetical protein [Pseudobdellovibrionaceae bacterium]
MAVFVSPLAFAGAGFSGGDTFESIDLVADITISCQEGVQRDFRSITCVENILNPGEYTYFVGPDGVTGDQVEVRATWEDGSIHEKSGSYNNQKGRTDKPFNLWISTLLQRPLLDMGKNDITWVMKGDGELVAAGNFSVQVNDGGQRACPRGYYTSSRLNDCRFPSDTCWRHFRAYNYCE